MRTLGTIVAVFVIAFAGVFAFYWMDRGSMEEAGREMDAGLSQIDRTTEPLQQSMEEMGEATVQSLERATDGDDRT